MHTNLIWFDLRFIKSLFIGTKHVKRRDTKDTKNTNDTNETKDTKDTKNTKDTRNTKDTKHTKDKRFAWNQKKEQKDDFNVWNLDLNLLLFWVLI